MASTCRHSFCLQHQNGIFSQHDSNRIGKFNIIFITYYLPYYYGFFVCFRCFKGPVLINPHLVTLWMWYVFVHVRGLYNHTGYQLPWLPSSQHHDYHHMASNACYGRTLAIDWLIGTDKGFRAYVARKKALLQKGTEKTVSKTDWKFWMKHEVVIETTKQNCQYLFKYVVKMEKKPNVNHEKLQDDDLSSFLPFAGNSCFLRRFQIVSREEFCNGHADKLLKVWQIGVEQNSRLLL